MQVRVALAQAAARARSEGVLAGGRRLRLATGERRRLGQVAPCAASRLHTSPHVTKWSHAPAKHSTPPATSPRASATPPSTYAAVAASEPLPCAAELRSARPVERRVRGVEVAVAELDLRASSVRRRELVAAERQQGSLERDARVGDAQLAEQHRRRASSSAASRVAACRPPSATAARRHSTASADGPEPVVQRLEPGRQPERERLRRAARSRSECGLEVGPPRDQRLAGRLGAVGRTRRGGRCSQAASAAEMLGVAAARRVVEPLAGVAPMRVEHAGSGAARSPRRGPSSGRSSATSRSSTSSRPRPSARATRSASSSPKLPSNTDSCRNSSRSAAASRASLASIDASSVPAAEHGALVEAVGDRRPTGSARRPRGGELERERQPVDPAADPRDRGRIPGTRLPAGAGGAGALGEQPLGRARAGRAVVRRAWAAATASGGTRRRPRRRCRAAGGS